MICLHTVKWFKVFLTLIIVFNINHLFAYSKVASIIAIKRK